MKRVLLALAVLTVAACDDESSFAGNDLAQPAPDLESPRDLSTSDQAMTVLTDLSVAQDLTAPVDLTAPDDLAPSPSPTPSPTPGPVVISTAPTSVATGSTLTVTGTNFDGATGVTLGGVMQSFDQVTATSLRISAVDAPLTGMRPLVVTTPAGVSAPFDVVVLDPLALSSAVATNSTTLVVTFSRDVDATTIADSDFVITGSGGLGVSAVVSTVGPVVTLTTASQTPSASYQLSVGAVADTFGNPLTGTSMRSFTGFVPAPAITSTAPTRAALGSSLVITGTNLSGATSVTIGGVEQTTFTVDSATQITIATVDAATPTHISNLQPLIITTPGGTNGSFGIIVMQPLAVSSVTATNATTLVVTFSRDVDAGSVAPTDFVITLAGGLGVSAVVSTVGAVVTLTTASQAPSTEYELSVGAVADTFGNPLTGTSTKRFFGFLPAPAITSTSPTSAALGSSLVITGTNLSGATSVTIGGVPQTPFTVDSATQITIAAVDAGTPTTGLQPLVVTTPGGSNTPAFDLTVLEALAVVSATALDPTTIKVTFSRALNDATVAFTDFSINSGGLGVSAVVSVAGEFVTLTTAAQTPSSPYLLSVTGAVADLAGHGLTGTSTAPFDGYVPPPPVISGTAPTTVALGATLILSGTNFAGASSVTISGVPQNTFTVDSATQITISAVDASTPTHDTNTQPVIVTTASGGPSASFGVIVVPPLDVVSAVATDDNTVVVTFSRALLVSTVAMTDFTITGAGGLNVNGASLTEPNKVTISTTEAQTPGASYEVAVAAGSVTDTFGNPLPEISTAPFGGFVPPPVVTGLNPATVVRGSATPTLTITGTNLASATSVTIGGVEHFANITGNTAGEITLGAIEASVLPGAQEVVVTTSGGISNAIAVEVLEKLYILSAATTSLKEVQVTFNRAVDPGTVNDTRFAIAGLTVTSATASGAIVTLKTTVQTTSLTYTVSTTADVKGLLGEPASATDTADFTVPLPTEFVVVKVGVAGGSLTGLLAPVTLERRLWSTGALGPSPSSLPMPAVDALPNKTFTLVGSATADGSLSRSPDGKQLALYGYTTVAGVAPSPVPRVVGIVDSGDFETPSGVDTSTTTGTSHSSTSPRGAVIDGSNIWLAGGQAFIYTTTLGSVTNGTSVSSTETSTRSIGIFEGQLYFTMGGTGPLPGGPGLWQVGTGTPTTLSTAANSTRQVTVASSYSFAVFDLNPNEPGVDTIYVTSDSGTAGVGGINRFNKTLGAWPTSPTAVLGPAAVRHVTCFRNGSNVECIAAAGIQGGFLYKLVDVNANTATSNSAMTQLSGTNTASGTAYRGIALAPIP